MALSMGVFFMFFFLTSYASPTRLIPALEASNKADKKSKGVQEAGVRTIVKELPA